MAFNLPPIRAVYSAALGAVLVYFTGNYELSNRKYFEPKTVIIYSLYMQSFCSASVAACFLADAHIEKPYLLQQLPKISVTLFFISFYFTRISSVFYFRILAKSGKCQDNVSIVSWIVTVILLGFKVSGYEEYHKSLGITIGITFGFLHLTIAFFVNEQVPKVYGLTENEILKLFGFCSLRNLIRYEDHRTFTCSEGTQLYFRNLTTGKVAIDVILNYSNLKN
uniref:Transmembrane protein n=1 Tax=Caenorhabditis tropicalis TaxID=1561998 RepID=A0A1I7UJ50_9PELO